MELLFERSVVIALAVAGAILSSAASMLQARGRLGADGARRLNYAGYAFMGLSMFLFVMAGLTGAAR